LLEPLLKSPSLHVQDRDFGRQHQCHCVLAQPELEPSLRGISWPGLGGYVVAAAVVVSRGPWRAAWRLAFLLSRAASSLRSRSAKITFSRPSSLSLGVT